jgi:hypothetical protein
MKSLIIKIEKKLEVLYKDLGLYLKKKLEKKNRSLF